MSIERPGSDQDVVLHPAPLKSIGMSLGSAITAFLCFRFWMEGLEYGWIAGSFLTLGSGFYAMHLVPSAYALTLSDDGFEVKELYAVKRYKWNEVTEFLARRGMLGATVEFHHQQPDAFGVARIRLSESFGRPPIKLAELLNEWRDWAVSQKPAARRNVWRSRTDQ